MHTFTIYQMHISTCDFLLFNSYVFTQIGVVCPIPSSPANGQVSGEGNRYGDTVNYTCNNGYMLRGNPSRKCQADGSWSGENPCCERKLLLNQ